MIILIVMMFPEYGVYPDSIEIHSRYGEPLRFTTMEACFDHVEFHLYGLEI